jgi:hypothetical protein
MTECVSIYIYVCACVCVCVISGSHGGECGDDSLLGYSAV